MRKPRRKAFPQSPPTARQRIGRRINAWFDILEPRTLMAVLTDGPMVGGVTSNSASVFVRTDQPASVAVDFSASAGFETLATSVNGATSKSHDFTAILGASGLQPESEYFYRVRVNGAVQATGAEGSFHTFPVTGSSREFAFAITSDVADSQRNPTLPAPVYERVEQDDPAFLLQIGDFDGRSPGTLAQMREMNREVRGSETAAGADFAGHIGTRLPVFHTWDDGDYGKGSGKKSSRLRSSALEAFQEYYPSPELPNPRQGVWNSFHYAQADVFMLDLRSQRDPSSRRDGPSKSMLDGSGIKNDQKDWLKAGLLNSTATWKFVVSSVPFNPTTPDDDAWHGYATERNEIVQYIRDHHIEGVIFISGDLKTGGAIDDGTHSDFPEISVPHTNLSSGTNGSAGVGQWSEGVIAGAGAAGYALIRVQGDRVILEVKGADGVVRQSLEIDGAGQPPPPPPPTGAPNLVVINTDDMRADMLAVMPIVNAELVQNGTNFLNSFVTTSLCCPSRSSLFTGEYAHNHGVHNNSGDEGGFEHFDDSSTIATWLHDAGYRTGLIGKYLNGYDGTIRPGWDDFQASPEPDYFDYDLSENGVTVHYGTRPEDYSTDVFARKSEEFIRSSEANDAQPFFLYMAPAAPHKPGTPAPRHRDAFQGIEPYRPPSFNEADVSDKPQWVQTDLFNSDDIAVLDERRQKSLESLLALDEAVAGILDTLRANGELENTVIIFTSDNGLLWGEHRQYGKKAAYEESIRVPLVIRDGRDLEPHRATEMALNIDLAPTLAELAGIAAPPTVDGQSLVPILEGQESPWRSDFLVEHWSHITNEEHIALRTERYLYAEYINGDRELYDLDNDPTELTSLHADPSQAELIRTLSARLHALENCRGAGCRSNDPGTPEDPGSLAIDVNRVFNTAAAKLAAFDAANPKRKKYPAESVINTNTWLTTSASNWRSGFYPGSLWLLYEQTGNAAWRSRAEGWTAGLEPVKSDAESPDLGFQIFDSFGHGFRLTGNAAYKATTLTAATTLSGRTNPHFGIQSRDNGNAVVVIDSMMNLELLFWAAKNGGVPAGGGTSQDLYQMAVNHASHVMLNHVRPDGSTFHAVDYDPNTGALLRQYTLQGMSDNSTWSRGQAWALYGFTVCYRETSDASFLETARRTADYFIDHLPADFVPQADFDSPFTDIEHKDSSAAAVAASGLIELSNLETDPIRRNRYWDAAVHILSSLTAAPYFSTDSSNAGILLHGSRRFPGDNTGLIFGDYYLIEAAARYAASAANHPAGP